MGRAGSVLRLFDIVRPSQPPCATGRARACCQATSSGGHGRRALPRHTFGENVGLDSVKRTGLMNDQGFSLLTGPVKDQAAFSPIAADNPWARNFHAAGRSDHHHAGGLRQLQPRAQLRHDSTGKIAGSPQPIRRRVKQPLGFQRPQTDPAPQRAFRSRPPQANGAIDRGYPPTSRIAPPARS